METIEKLLQRASELTDEYNMLAQKERIFWVETLKGERENTAANRQEYLAVYEELLRIENSQEVADAEKEIRDRRKLYRNCFRRREWQTYEVPEGMPEALFVCDAEITLPARDGGDKSLEVPLTADLFQSNVIAVVSEQKGEGTEFAVKLLARMLKTIPHGGCRYYIFDTQKKGASLGKLIRFTNEAKFGVDLRLVDGVAHNANNTWDALCDQTREINNYLSGKYASLFEYQRNNPGEWEYPFTWCFCFEFPQEKDEMQAQKIRQVLEQADRDGYSFVFVVTSEERMRLERMTAQAEIAMTCVDMDRLFYKKDGLTISVTDTCLRTPDEEQTEELINAIAKFYGEGMKVENSFRVVFPSMEINGGDAGRKIAVPIAVDAKGKLVNLEMGEGAEIHGFISGGTGSGKTKLLHTVIVSSCLHYSPEELELWLIDYKQAEFYLYKNNRFPQIKLVGVSDGEEFSFDFLERIRGEMDRRKELLMKFAATSLEEYRRHREEPGVENLPRLLVVIDEFHKMSQQVANDMKYRTMLENIFREARALGITMLLADQTFSTGLGGLSEAAKNQIGLRIAMKNEMQEIRETLGVGREVYTDSVMRDISGMEPGEFIIRSAAAEGNTANPIRLEKRKGIYTENSDIQEVGAFLMKKYPEVSQEELLYVNTNERVEWNLADMEAMDRILDREEKASKSIRFYLGRTAKISPCFCISLKKKMSENLAIVGGDTKERWAVILAVLLSCREKKYKTCVFTDFSSDMMADYGDSVEAICEETENMELFADPEKWGEKLSELKKCREEQRNGEDTVCIFAGLEDAWKFLSARPEKKKDSPESLGGSYQRLAARIGATVVSSGTAGTIESVQQKEYDILGMTEELFCNGARYGARCVVEVSTYREFCKIGNLSKEEYCRHKIAFEMNEDDCIRYLGKAAFQKMLGENTALYKNNDKDNAEKLLTYKIG